MTLFRLRLVLLLVPFLAVAAGCGKKGPLYLPDEEPKAQAPAAPDKK